MYALPRALPGQCHRCIDPYAYLRRDSYHHGASSYAHNKIPASYLPQWTAIRDALKRGDRVYNFWGIAPGTLTEEGFKISEPKHPFGGVTLFKTGFGGNL